MSSAETTRAATDLIAAALRRLPSASSLLATVPHKTGTTWPAQPLPIQLIIPGAPWPSATITLLPYDTAEEHVWRREQGVRSTSLAWPAEEHSEEGAPGWSISSIQAALSTWIRESSGRGDLNIQVITN